MVTSRVTVTEFAHASQTRGGRGADVQSDFQSRYIRLIAVNFGISRSMASTRFGACILKQENASFLCSA